MTPDFSTSNLSKIATKFRTSGAISQPRRKAGSPLKDIGLTDVKVVNITTQDKYLNRLIEAYSKTENEKLKKFLYEEIRKIKVQTNTW